MKRCYGQRYLYLGKIMMARLGFEVFSMKTWGARWWLPFEDSIGML